MVFIETMMIKTFVSLSRNDVKCGLNLKFSDIVFELMLAEFLQSCYILAVDQ